MDRRGEDCPDDIQLQLVSQTYPGSELALVMITRCWQLGEVREKKLKVYKGEIQCLSEQEIACKLKWHHNHSSLQSNREILLPYFVKSLCVNFFCKSIQKKTLTLELIWHNFIEKYIANWKTFETFGQEIAT